ncbi:MAG: type I glutamate--ammonia ligase, partial [Neisseriaceae bacterium]|nr:type I glutamate--ammonia ligase [Neisseriaceae bacterium]
ETLEEALNALREDHEFLIKGGVFSKDWVESYLELKLQEARKISIAPHPLEFDMYYSL